MDSVVAGCTMAARVAASAAVTVLASGSASSLLPDDGRASARSPPTSESESPSSASAFTLSTRTPGAQGCPGTRASRRCVPAAREDLHSDRNQRRVSGHVKEYMRNAFVGGTNIRLALVAHAHVDPDGGRVAGGCWHSLRGRWSTLRGRRRSLRAARGRRHANQTRMRDESVGRWNALFARVPAVG